MRGPVLLPGSAAYERVRPVFNGRYDGVHPAAIAQPLDARDLAAALRVARARELAVRVRAGGHSYIGASTVAGGVVLDLRRLRGIQVLADGSVLAGAGLRQIELISALAKRGRAVVHGSCPTVGVAGFTLGGGYGFDARRHGLACDTLLAAHVVDLRTLRPAAADAELLRGLRGAGASLAPVTDLRLRTHAVGGVTTFFASYPWSRAAEVARAFVAACRRRAGAARVDLLALDRRGRRDGPGVRAVPRHRRRSVASDRGIARAGRERLPARAPLPRGAARLRRLPRQDRRAVPPPERGRRARARHVRRRLRLHRALAHDGRGASARRT